MTEEFKKKMNEAMEQGILIAKKQDKEYLEKAKINKQFADLYIELVLAFIRQFDFQTGTFHCDKVNKDILSKFGQPRYIFANISEETQKGTIFFDYGDKNNSWLRVGEPEFKKQEGFDMNIVNDLLQENDIIVREDSVDTYGLGSQNDYISFDASMLIETRNKLLEESPKLKKKTRK